MMYDTKNRVLHICDYRKVDLTNLEHMLMLGLSSGNMVTYEEILKYMYGWNDIYAKRTLHVIVSNLTKKTEGFLRILVIRGRGLLMETEMYYK